MQYFASIAYQYGGSWYIAETPEEALRGARRIVAMTARELRKATHYVLEFTDDADIQPVSDIYGGWRSSVAPVRVERALNLPEGVTESELLGTSTTVS